LRPPPGRTEGSRGGEFGDFGDFELRFRYQVEGFNSGVQYRSVDRGGWQVDGLQTDFEACWHEDKAKPGAPPADRFTGMFFEENGRMFTGQRGDVVVVRANPENPKQPKIKKIASLGDPAELEKVIRRDGWNDYSVIARGNQFTHIVNGRVLALGLDEDEPSFRRSGILAFQLHGGRPMRIAVKDVRVRELKQRAQRAAAAVTSGASSARACRPVSHRAGQPAAPCAAPSSAPTTTPRWQLSPPAIVLATRPAAGSSACFSARNSAAGNASPM
jgi:hypothetical protein